MSSETLPVFSHPDFPQVFTQAISHQSGRLFPRPTLAQLCDYEFPESREGACDGRPCYHLATHVCANGLVSCDGHDAEVSCG
jgi:hypothetical protein